MITTIKKRPQIRERSSIYNSFLLFMLSHTHHAHCNCSSGRIVHVLKASSHSKAILYCTHTLLACGTHKAAASLENVHEK
jgi:hypothetical protein